MAKRHLTLRRETVSQLDHDELAEVVGAISAPHVVCTVTSIQFSWCHTCGIACTYQCTETS